MSEDNQEVKDTFFEVVVSLDSQAQVGDVDRRVGAEAGRTPRCLDAPSNYLEECWTMF